MVCDSTAVRRAYALTGANVVTQIGARHSKLTLQSTYAYWLKHTVPHASYTIVQRPGPPDTLTLATAYQFPDADLIRIDTYALSP